MFEIAFKVIRKNISTEFRKKRSFEEEIKIECPVKKPRQRVKKQTIPFVLELEEVTKIIKCEAKVKEAR
jgi:hypothetical protein